jgi:pimeloyl-ACP methyl ester carboxylesterase
VIAVDRPGLGGSGRQHGRRILDWPADVGALADVLGLGRFGVLGYSGGVPYALACAQLLPGRVTAAGLVACVGPDEIAGLVAGLDPAVAKIRRTSRTRPWLARATWAGVRMAARRYPQRVLAQTAAALPEPDRRALADPPMASAYLAALREALRPGAAGAVQDMALMASPWRLSPEQIQIPVLLWQGELDRNAPPVMARHLAKLIPHCITHWFPGDGHLSIIANHGQAILAGLHPPATP